jgi:hypothetical protein
MVQMSVKMMKAFSPDSVPFNEDSVTQAITDKMWEKFNNEVDSVIDYSEDIPDSVKNDPESMAIINKMNVFMKGSKKEGPLYMGLHYQFDNREELIKFYDFMDKRDRESGKSNPISEHLLSSQSRSVIKFENKTLSRVTPEEAEPMHVDSVKALDLMFADASYKTTITMPTKIVSAKGDGLQEINGKTVVYQYKMRDLFTGKMSNDFEIKIK